VTYVFGLDGEFSEQETDSLAEIETQIARVQDPGLSADVPAEDLPLGLPAAYWLDLRDYRPAERARDLGQPMLILQGARDYQVTVEDYEGWQQALAEREDVTFKLYEDLDYLFVAGEGQSEPAQEYTTLGHVAAVVIDDIVAWIGQP
jgi:fermentation-respiration switch protein FrsA (DUF1100 family)